MTVRDLGRRLLNSLLNPSHADFPNTPVTASPSRPLTVDTSSDTPLDDDSFRIGFITPPFRDSKIPVTDHLHAHAYILPADRMGWWRAVGFSGVAWYAVDDLIAEIRYACYSYLVRASARQVHRVSVRSTRTRAPDCMIVERTQHRRALLLRPYASRPYVYVGHR